MKRLAAAALLVMAAAPASAQPSLADVLAAHGVRVEGGNIEAAFDAGERPTTAVAEGALAQPLAVLQAGTGKARIEAAYAFGVLAGRSAVGVAPQDLEAAQRAFIQMIGDGDHRTRVAGARVAGRVLAVPLAAAEVPRRAALEDALFALFNRQDDVDQLVAMDALGQLRSRLAVASLVERDAFYRDANRRALAGGAVEALARIGDPAAVPIVQALVADRWAEGRDPTAVAVAFARERLLKDGSAAMLTAAAGNRATRAQARGYLAELGLPVP